MALLLVLFLFVLLTFSLFFIFLFARRKNNTFPPGPRGLPFIGNLHQFDNSNPHLYLHKLSKTYGPLMSMKLGSVPVLVISSARVAKQAFTTNDIAFSGRPKLTGQQKHTYDGVDITFSPYGDYWREIRKTVALNLFSHKQVNFFSPIRREEVSRMIKDISEKSSAGQVINLKEILLSLSSNIICRVVFGKSDEETSSSDKTFDDLIDEVQFTFSGFYIGDYIPLLGWVDKLLGTLSRLEKSFKAKDAFLQEIIDEHLSLNRPKSVKGDMVDLLIHLKEQQTSSMNFSWNHVKAILTDIFIAGSDTSAVVLISAMTALLKTPSVMKKVQEEIRGVVGDKYFVEEGDISKLPYLKAVIKETMRLYPPTPILIPRETTKTCFMDGYEIQPKSLVFVNVWLINRDPDYWENPHEFLPDRFLNSTIDYKGNDFGFIPFGSGRRICPGITFGTATVEIALANLLFSFNWKLPDKRTQDGIDTDAASATTIFKKTPVFVMAEAI